LIYYDARSAKHYVGKLVINDTLEGCKNREIVIKEQWKCDEPIGNGAASYK
jgi:hypothetical protein